MNNNTLNQKSPLGDLGVKIRSTKVMKPTNTIGSNQGQVIQSRMASSLAVTKYVPHRDALEFHLYVLTRTPSYLLIPLFTHLLLSNRKFNK